LHQIALEQTIPGITDESHYDAEQVHALAQKLTAETLQLYYQIALIGRRDLPLAPTPRSGFEMVLLRMLAFSPETVSIQHFLTPKETPVKTPAQKPAAEKPQTSAPVANTPAPPALEKPLPTAPTQSPSLGATDTDWGSLLTHLNLQGAAAIVASHCVLVTQTAGFVQLALDPHHAPLLNKNTEAQIATALQKHFQKPITFVISVGEGNQETPALLDRKSQEQRQSQATDELTADKHLQSLMDQFGGKIITNSIKAK
jgi:DNA polymerase-3 subunit gamma/tau